MAVLLNTSLLAGIFHEFPHLDFNFYNTTTIFTPDNTRYQQALLFNGIYLLFTSLVLFILFSIYFLICSCYFCTCRPQPLKPKAARSRCLRLLICFLAVISCSALGVAFYANNKTQNGIEGFSNAAVNIYQIFDLYNFKNVVIRKFIDVGAIAPLQHIQQTIQEKFGNSSVIVTQLLVEMTHVDRNLKYAMNLLRGMVVNTQGIANVISEYDSWRWWVTLCALLWHGFLVLVIIYSTYTQRRCSFVVLTIMAVVSLFLMMTIVSVDTPLSIAAADLCHYPRESVLQYAQSQVGRDVLAYYLDCTNYSADPLLIQPYHNMSRGLDQATTLAASLVRDPWVKKVDKSKKYIVQIQSSIASSRVELGQLVVDLGCKRIKQNFDSGISNVCQIVIDGLGLLILTSFVMSVLLIMILLCVTPVWKGMAPLRPILKSTKYGVHLVTNSYQGPPGGSDSYHGSSSFDVSYKSIDDPEEFEHLPLINKRERPPSYRATLSSPDFHSLEEEQRSIKNVVLLDKQEF